MPSILYLLLNAVTGRQVVHLGSGREIWLWQAPAVHLAIGEGGQILQGDNDFGHHVLGHQRGQLSHCRGNVYQIRGDISYQVIRPCIQIRLLSIEWKDAS